MVDITGVAHFAIPVSDPDRSTRFYTDIVGCKYLSALPDKSMTFLDAGGICVLLIKRPAPIITKLEDSYGVHHAFMVAASAYHGAVDHLRANGVNIFFEEDRRGGRDRWSARLFPRSGRHGSGIHRSHGLRRQQVKPSYADRKDKRFSMLEAPIAFNSALAHFLGTLA
jgi:catechol 2,3-dioxygenase-like lactoylglutathione lyase family enzyme